MERVRAIEREIGRVRVRKREREREMERDREKEREILRLQNISLKI